MNLFLIIVSATLGVLGDILCKYGAQHPSKAILCTFGAALTWATCSLFWTYFYKSKSIVEMVVIFNPIQIIILTCTGLFLFGEPLTWRTGVGIICVLIAVGLNY